jgi:hypothetical protein
MSGVMRDDNAAEAMRGIDKGPLAAGAVQLSSRPRSAPRHGSRHRSAASDGVASEHVGYEAPGHRAHVLTILRARLLEQVVLFAERYHHGVQ